MTTIFEKIITKEIPADIVYEDDLCLAFHDINPQAPVHVLLIPKREIPSAQHVSSQDSELMGHLMAKIPEIAKVLEMDESGYRLVVNCGKNGGQEVEHLHIHMLGGRKMKWPPG